MASLRRSSKSPYWIACYTLRDGRRTNRSTKTKNRRDAQRIAQQWEDAERSAVLTIGAVRKNLVDAWERANGEEAAHDSVRSFFDRWVAQKSGEVAASSAKTYQRVAESFLEHLDGKANLSILSLRKSDVSRWLSALAQEKSVATANHRLKVLRSALQEAVRDELIDTNPASLVKPLKTSASASGQRRPFTLDEAKAILSKAKGEWKTLVLLGFYTGQRMGDLCRLHWQHISFEAGEISFTTMKTARKQAIPLAPALAAHLESIFSDAASGPIMPDLHRRYERHGSGGVSNEFRRLMAKAGVVEERSNRKTAEGRGGKRKASPVSFHSYRHTLTSLLKSAGVSGQITQEIVGHDSASVSKGYSHIDSAAIRDAVLQIPDIRQENS